MRNRERGAAHVNILFFLVMLVLFLAALMLGYAQMSENNDLKVNIEKAKHDVAAEKVKTLLREEQLKRLGEILGEKGKFVPKEDYKEILKDAGLPENEPPVYADGPVPERVADALKTFRSVMTVPDTQSQLSATFGGAKEAYELQVKTAADANTQRVAALAERESLEKRATDENTTRTKELNAEKQAHSEFHATWENGRRSFDDLLNSMRTTNAQKDKDLEEEKQKHQADNLKNAKEINTLRAVISSQTERMKLINPPQAPDAEILSSSPSVGLAFINIGRNNMLPVGTLFRVSGRGKNDIKAYAEVTKLEQDRAEVRITGVKDPYDPVVRGDQLSNDLYAPNVKRTIALIGRYSLPLTKDVVKTLLENLGNTVVDKIGPGVDLVIIGDDMMNDGRDGFTPIRDSQEYKDALFHGIETAPLNKVRDFLKLGT